MEHLDEVFTILKFINFEDGSRLSYAIKLLLIFSTLIILVTNMTKLTKGLTSILFKLINRKNTGILEENIKIQCDVDKVINSMLLSIVKKRREISRITVAQFHNGVVFKSGIPYEKILFLNEACDPGVAASKLVENGDFNMLLFGDIILPLLENGVVIKSVEELSSGLQIQFGKDGTLSIAAGLIKHPYENDRIIGLVLIQNIHSTKFVKCADTIENDIKVITDKLAGLFEVIKFQEAHGKKSKKKFFGSI